MGIVYLMTDTLKLLVVVDVNGYMFNGEMYGSHLKN